MEMTEFCLGDDDPGFLPDEFERIIGSGFGNGNYVRAVVENNRTPQEEAVDIGIAMWCRSSQARSESLRQKSPRFEKAGKFLSIVLSGSRGSSAK